MKHSLFLALLALSLTPLANASGFLCRGRSTGVEVSIFNHVQPSRGTQSVHVMVLSNPSIHSPHKTIARFTDENQTLSYLGYGKYAAKVDLRFNDSGRSGENIGGTKLGQIKTIHVNLNFANNGLDNELSQLADIEGLILYTKRNGEVLTESVTCKRYLKN